MNTSKKGIGFIHAWNGLFAVFKNERNFRIHLAIFILVLIISFYFRLTVVEWSLILFVSALVLVTEIINSAMEMFTDFIFVEQHKTAKYIKDVSAAAVLVSAIFAIIIGILIFTPKLFY